MSTKSKERLLLQPHELAKILGWKVRKVFRKLHDGKIPAERIEHKGKVRFFASPIGLKRWIVGKRLDISLEGRTLLEDKAALERTYWQRNERRQMVQNADRAEEGSRTLQRLRLEQARLMTSLARQAAA